MYANQHSTLNTDTPSLGTAAPLLDDIIRADVIAVPADRPIKSFHHFANTTQTSAAYKKKKNPSRAWSETFISHLTSISRTIII